MAEISGLFQGLFLVSVLHRLQQGRCSAYTDITLAEMLTAVGVVFTSREQQFSFHFHQICTFLAPPLLLCCQQSPGNRAPVSLFVLLINTQVLSCRNETEANKKYNCLGHRQNEPCKESRLAAHGNPAAKSSFQRINGQFPSIIMRYFSSH